jgi:hypothetical protein
MTNLLQPGEIAPMTRLRMALLVAATLLLGAMAPVTGCAEQSRTRWRQTDGLAAPEAVQAAAADATCLYAIGNQVVAKYDRRTGKRIASSKGKATHLNSGFFWEGRLYCAHSNYPQTPELSEIMVLDPDTMELSVFKSFGSYGGSLTWAVRHDGRWWCNFARYGDGNAGTFLAAFNDDWEEQDRWTYPTEVIQAMDRHSLSGGIWRDGHLLATDHDHRVVYQLQLPQQGSVLELIEIQPAPFTGQGIAEDPVTGGLVGIDRAKRQIIMATNGSRP